MTILKSQNSGLCTRAVPALEPQVALPPDPEQPDLARLFDNEWVWRQLSAEFGMPDGAAERFRLRRLSYRPGRRVTASYEVRWPEDMWLSDDRFAIGMTRDKPLQLYHYPDNPNLPGLAKVASPVDAPALLSKYVQIHPRRIRLEVVRYRPGSRAVLRYTTSGKMKGIGRSILFVRAMPPRQVPRLLTAAALSKRSGFVLPRLVGCWPEGGVVWNVRIPGDNVREMVFAGNGPNPDMILDHLERLWAGPEPDNVHPRRLLPGFRDIKGLLFHLFEEPEHLELLQRVVDGLEPWVEQWRPTALAHNDFYDDQMLFIPDTGRLALVDFEETAFGDPLLDVGNNLAHLSRSVRMGAPQTCADYRLRFRSAALSRFGWREDDLALREAYALFRLSANPFQALQANWKEAMIKGLAVADDVLQGAI